MSTEKDTIDLVLNQCLKSYDNIKKDVEKHFAELKPKEKNAVISAHFALDMFLKAENILPKTKNNNMIMHCVKQALEHFIAHLVTQDDIDENQLN